MGIYEVIIIYGFDINGHICTQRPPLCVAATTTTAPFTHS